MGFFNWLKRLLGMGSRDPGPMTAAQPGSQNSARLSATEVLARTRQLYARNAQWPEIWSELNPGCDPVVQQLLADLRNDGIQFAPSDGLRKIEIACEDLAGEPRADVADVLRKALGKDDVLDRFR